MPGIHTIGVEEDSMCALEVFSVSLPIGKITLNKGDTALLGIACTDYKSASRKYGSGFDKEQAYHYTALPRGSELSQSPRMMPPAKELGMPLDLANFQLGKR